MALDIKQAHLTQQWAHDRPLVCCRFDPQGRYVFCGAQDEALHRFALADGTKVSYTGGHEAWIRTVACTRDGSYVISGGADGRLVWWEAAASEAPPPARTVEAHHGWIRSIDLSPDGSMLVTGGNDTLVRLWNTADGAPIKEFAGHERDVYTVLFHPGGEFILSGDLMGKLKQWNVATGELVREFDASTLHNYNGGQQVDFGGVRGIAVSPDGQFLTAGGLHKATNPLGAVHEPLSLVFNWETAELLKSQVSDGITKGVIWRMQYLSDGTAMAVCGGGSGGFLLFYTADGDKDFHRFKLPNLARDMDLHPDGIQVATAHYDKHVRITRLAAD